MCLHLCYIVFVALSSSNLYGSTFPTVFLWLYLPYWSVWLYLPHRVCLPLLSLHNLYGSIFSTQSVWALPSVLVFVTLPFVLSVALSSLLVCVTLPLQHKLFGFTFLTDPV